KSAISSLRWPPPTNSNRLETGSSWFSCSACPSQRARRPRTSRPHRPSSTKRLLALKSPMRESGTFRERYQTVAFTDNVVHCTPATQARADLGHVQRVLFAQIPRRQAGEQVAQVGGASRAKIPVTWSGKQFTQSEPHPAARGGYQSKSNQFTTASAAWTV